MIGTEQERHAQLDDMYPVWEQDTLWTRFTKSAKQFPNHEYIVFEDVAYTYAQTWKMARHISVCLYAQGIRPGSHVALRLPNGPEFVFLTFALARLGAVKIPINAVISQDELTHILNKAEAELLFFCKEEDAEVLACCPMLKRAVSIHEDRSFSRPRLLNWPEFCAGAGPEDAEAVEALDRMDIDPEVISDIMFTSGSTALSKGAVLSADGLLRAAFATCRTRCFEIGRRMLVPVPLFHAFAYVDAVLALLYVGGTLVMTRERHFRTEYALRQIKEYRANDVIVLGVMMIKLVAHLREHPQEFPELHAAFFGENSIDSLWEDTMDVFQIDDVTTGSGMTEISSTAFMTTPTTPLDCLKRYCGRPKAAGCAGIPESGGILTEVMICDPKTGEPIRDGEVGEMRYRGPAVAKRYFNNPEATAHAFPGDGWFRSDDLWRKGEDGYYAYCGRMNDTFKINGENVSPIYVDRVIGKCPLVAAAATVGVVHPGSGCMVGVAFVEPVQDSEDVRQEIEAYCQANLAKFQVPRHFFYIDSRDWPRTGTNKVTKKGLREYAVQLLRAQEE